MKLPHADKALIDAEKLRDYLLSSTHPVGRFKAPVFLRMGYSQNQWEQLAADLRSQHLSSDVQEASESNYGMKYVIRARLKGPNGTAFEFVSVWIVLEGENVPRV